MLQSFSRKYVMQIDLKKLEITHSSNALYYDKDRNTSVLLVQLILDNKVVDLTDLNVYTIIKSPDGNICTQQTEIIAPDEGGIGIKLSENALVEGINKLQIVLTDKLYNNILNTPLISFRVLKAMEGNISEDVDNIKFKIDNFKFETYNNKQLESQMQDLLGTFNRIYAIEMDLKSLDKVYNSKAIYTNGDRNTATLLIKLKMDNEDFNLAGCNAYAIVESPDGNLYKQNTYILFPDEGGVGIDLGKNALIEGTNKLQIVLTDSKGDIMLVPCLTYKVIPTMEGNVEDDEENISLLLSLIQDVGDAITKVNILESDISLQESIRQEQELIRVNSENERNISFSEMTNKLNEKITIVTNKTLEVDAKLTEVDTTITDANSQVESMKTSFDEKVVEVDSTILNANSQVESMKTSFDEKVKVIDEKVDSTILNANNQVESMKAIFNEKVEDVDIKIVETNETIADANSQVESMKAIFDEKVAISNEKINEISTQISNADIKIQEVEILKNETTVVKSETEVIKTQAEEKILDIEERMKNIENDFNDLIDGSGFATKVYVDGELTKKSDLEHIHDDIYYNKDEIDEKLAGIDEIISANVGNRVTVTDKQWTLVDNVYVTNVVHGINTNNVIIDVYDSNGESVIVGKKIIDRNTIELKNDVATNLVVYVVNAGIPVENIDVSINDEVTSEITTWSSIKIQSELDKKSTDAKNTSFDNSTNGMTAINVQSAIEENKTSISKLQSEIEKNKSSILDLQNQIGIQITRAKTILTSLSNKIE